MPTQPQHSQLADVVPQSVLAVPLLLFHNHLGQCWHSQNPLINEQGILDKVLAVVVLPASCQFDVPMELLTDLLLLRQPTQ